MRIRQIVLLAMVATLMMTIGCKDQAVAAKKAPAKAAPKPKPKPVAKPAPKPVETKPKEIVFDPRSPPAGYVNCHRNHCHKVGGGVASYQQVMSEIGATKIIGVPKAKPMPKAPADVAKPPADAVRAKSGLVTKVLRPGDGKRKPGPTSIVTVHYTGWTTAGAAFDSSVARGEPATFPLNRVFPGWTEGIQMMSIGEERRFWIPEALAFNGRPGPPRGTLVFDVELLSIR